MTETVMAVPLDKCSYFPKTKKLFVPLSALKSTTGESRYPKSFFVRSHFTNNLLEFKVIGTGDPLYDQDQWDGEIMVYRPHSGVASKIDYAVLAHEDLA
jgi:hypothetical protein